MACYSLFSGSKNSPRRTINGHLTTQVNNNTRHTFVGHQNDEPSLRRIDLGSRKETLVVPGLGGPEVAGHRNVPPSEPGAPTVYPMSRFGAGDNDARKVDRVNCLQGHFRGRYSAEVQSSSRWPGNRGKRETPVSNQEALKDRGSVQSTEMLQHRNPRYTRRLEHNHINGSNQSEGQRANHFLRTSNRHCFTEEQLGLTTTSLPLKPTFCSQSSKTDKPHEQVGKETRASGKCSQADILRLYITAYKVILH
ncbi:unnamed protein product [Protopolystoma xenopodis]|uniref:Uncharacterized protein n=1 Tax=Protopolystoma xenopodis TaxID=117903 RepID=A0A3S5AHG4_9PLAT|nr:unnamed protein product [Protopolystoma xenopodis]